MMESKIMKKNYDSDDANYCLTEHAILYETLKDYGMDVGEWRNSLWRSIYNDFMNELEKNGYISKCDNANNNGNKEFFDVRIIDNLDLSSMDVADITDILRDVADTEKSEIKKKIMIKVIERLENILLDDLK